MVATSVPPVPPAYSERLLPGPLGWLIVVLFAAGMGVVLYPVSPPVAAGVGLVMVAIGGAVAILTTLRVEVRGGELRAGAAHIPLGLLGEVRALDAGETRLELGPALDARAYLCLRAWAHTAVRAEVLDPADATPYWIVSTRHPQELARAVAQARERPADRDR
ncbi:DUF3093 domain-containing protein [Pengzhenrongella sicca]|uniref:DUF3093 domain-containing protein n=1 Tax=Pengzhenrongella sicca TaxID=2819238 RepID=A0A8A4ZBE8_9MICO|nr:DUF3093 domain-containing protein [Pengzhenrongella sicca]QTE28339.1 DUF3093 domain-containing protein [Pengzhenrongella sicca]